MHSGGNAYLVRADNAVGILVGPFAVLVGRRGHPGAWCDCVGYAVAVIRDGILEALDAAADTSDADGQAAFLSAAGRSWGTLRLESAF